ncbi:MTRF1L release factor glutamine methyltransferase [Nilaparvata lugens]|uniref:MTRF1L release factor glutamine methyltransferase n=1 Tax=Nilaparvata lugens TaxID=108931 RepID=UPI00193DD8D6|nr:MTRF1L release factor glutamine methyltransferase [Nilaparvata lugens]
MNDFSSGQGAVLFVEDTTLIARGVTVEQAKEESARLLEVAELWFLANKLKLNEDKTNILHVRIYTFLLLSLVDVQTQLDAELDLNQRTHLDRCCLQRLARLPVQYILGEWEFRGLTLSMRAPVFIPRPETEQLIDVVLAEQSQLESPPACIVELGCGSGAISIALATAYPQAKIYAIEASEEACNLAKENCRRLELCERVHVMNAKLMSNGSLLNGSMPDCVDVLVSNPPYIKTADITSLQPEITLYEDLRALDGGMDGMQVVGALLLLLVSSKPCNAGKGITLYMEIDPSLYEPIRQWTLDKRNLGVQFGNIYKDIYAVDRFMSVHKVDKYIR